MVTHSSILAWKIPTDRGVWWATVHGVPRAIYDWATEHARLYERRQRISETWFHQKEVVPPAWINGTTDNRCQATEMVACVESVSKQVEAEISFWSGKLALIWKMLHFLKHGTEITRSGLLCIFGQEYNFDSLTPGPHQLSKFWGPPWWSRG